MPSPLASLASFVRFVAGRPLGVVATADGAGRVRHLLPRGLPRPSDGPEGAFVRIRPRWGRFPGLAGPRVDAGRPPWLDADE